MLGRDCMLLALSVGRELLLLLGCEEEEEGGTRIVSPSEGTLKGLFIVPLKEGVLSWSFLFSFPVLERKALRVRGDREASLKNASNSFYYVTGEYTKKRQPVILPVRCDGKRL